ncbi:MAG: glycosyltransferase [Intrasporangium sp.]|uniref:glycosyltransferase n=1 Tax=Intrasporangium sp. TaxID=1925024 RepID=UPI0026498537|nr:glycosyltransferase [Intrasporangium sp.]MDN5794744.1 glycosyltransferase [Intrasporangium sp.]
MYDFDDALFADMTSTRRLLGQERKCEKSASAADVVIAGNDYLAEWAEQFSANVVMIPSCVEPSDYKAKDSWTIEGPPTLVWLGSPSTEQFIAGIADALWTVHAATGARLLLISGQLENPELGALEHMIDRVPWTPSVFAPALHRADVAVGPLSDTAFTRGKCAYKLLQYAASALPMVASPVGANALALQRFDGIAAASPSEWVEALIGIIEDEPARRRERGKAALNAVAQHYSFSVWSTLWRSATGVGTSS